MQELNNKVLFILLDAFRYDYINAVDTPFLYSKTRTGIYAEKMKSTAGFTQRTAIYTGTTGIESGMFTMYTFDVENSPFRFLKNDPRYVRFSVHTQWFDKLPAWRGMRIVKNLMKSRFEDEIKVFRQWIQQEAKKYANYAPIGHIPISLLPEIGVSEDNRPIHLPGAFEQESIFDIFVHQHVKYEYLMYPIVDGDDDATLQAFLANKDSNVKILLGQFSDSDSKIHHCGPASHKRREVTGEIDRKLREIAAYYNDDTTWIVIGDHGMTDVIDEIDIPAVLSPLERKLNVKMGRDYFLFLDSTMARFRWITETGKAFFEEVMRLPILLKKGRFIDEKMAKEYFIPVADRCYGDLIWWANNGVLLAPDYFHDRHMHNKGMHGYASNHNDMKGFFLAFGSGIAPRRLDQVNLIDVCPTICDLLGISYPNQNKGISVIHY